MSNDIEWKMVQIKELLRIGNGRDYKHLKAGDIPVYGTGGYMCSVNDYLYDGDTVCIGRKGTIDEPQFHSGKIWTVDTLFYTHSFDGVFPKYLFYVFCMIDWKSKNEATGVPSLSKGIIEKIYIPIPYKDGEPDLETQELIAQKLSCMDSLIAAKEKLLAKKRNLKIGAMQKLIKQEESENWKMIKLGKIGTVSMCKRIMKDETSETGDIPFYKIGTFGALADAYISKKLFEEYKGKFSYPKKGDILISAAGTIGRTVVFNGESAYFQDSNIVWLDHDETKILNNYLYYLYNIIQWHTTSGGIIERLYNDNIIKTEIPIPFKNGSPDLIEQKRIATILSDMDSEIASIENEISKLRNLKTAMMQKLFCFCVAGGKNE